MDNYNCQEDLQNIFIVPEDSRQSLPYASNLDNNYRDVNGRYVPLLYKDFDFFAGQVLDLLPGRDQTFNDRKLLTLDLAKIYCHIRDAESDYKLVKRWSSRAAQLTNCNVYMQTSNDRVFNASFCRVRLCPMCAWRRSLKIALHTRKIITAMLEQSQGYRFLFVTLTVPNVFDADLDAMLDKMGKAWRKMTNKTKNTRPGSVPDRFNKSVCGWYRGLEITRNMDYYKMRYYRDKSGHKRKMPICNPGEYGFRILNPWYKSYHPHYHCIMAVPADYFVQRSGKYIDQQEWLNMWRWAMRDQSITQVDVREIKPNPKIVKRYQDAMSREQIQALAVISAVEEATHYTVKSDDYIMDQDATRLLDLVLERRRLVAYGGVMADVREQIKLDDEIDGDLLVDGATPTEQDAVIKSYAFSVGFSRYVRIDNI